MGMETIAMQMNANLYRMAENYAQRHKTNVQELVERYVLNLLSADETTSSPKTKYQVKPIEELPIELQSLIGIARKDGIAPTEDINGRDVREAYLANKYAR